MPTSRSVNPFTTDQNPFLPKPYTLNNGDIKKSKLSAGAPPPEFYQQMLQTVISGSVWQGMRLREAGSKSAAMADSSLTEDGLTGLNYLVAEQ